MSRISLWLPVLVYMAILFGVSAMPEPPEPPGVSQLSDKAQHGLAYAGLGALVVRALAGGWGRPVTLGVAAGATLVSALYGVSDEIHQHFVPPREMEALDVAADAIGALIGSLALYVVHPAEAKRAGALHKN